MILAIDQGTSSTKACVFEPPGSRLGEATVPVARRCGEDGTVTQDPFELVESCRRAAREALRSAGVAGAQLKGAALANQGESFLLFDAGGQPLTAVVSWQDTNCGDAFERLRERADPSEVQRLTGLPLHAEFTAPKLTHQLSRLGGDIANVRFGTLDTWLMNRLDPARPHLIDRATASRTMLVGLADDDWNDHLLDWFGVPRHLLPRIVPCDRPEAVLELDGTMIPLLASGYDMGLALLGHGCLAAGETKATFGTSLGVMAATGGRPIQADGLLTAIAYERDGVPAYALDGEIAAAGALVAWATGLGIAGSLAELDRLAASVRDAGGVVIVPAIQGLGAPHWRDDVRGSVFGLTAGTGRAQFARAVLDAIAWSIRDVLDRLRASGVACPELRVDGGLTNSETLLQRCADVARTTIVVNEHREATLYGAAALAMLSHGLASEADVRGSAVGRRRFEPRSEPSETDVGRWRRALALTLDHAPC